jgi:hypothetical protein
MPKSKPIQKKKRTKQAPLNWSGIKFDDALRTLLKATPQNYRKVKL